MQNTKSYVDVLLPLPVRGYFTYLVPDHLKDKVESGKRVVVPFGVKKLYAGLIRKVHNNSPSSKRTKEIISVQDEKPLVLSQHFKFWEWVAEYYMCNVGEVMNAALPAALKLSSETEIIINEKAILDEKSFSIQETNLLKELEKKKKLTISKAIKAAGIKKIIPLINNLIEKGIITTREFVNETYKPQKTKFIKLSAEYEEDEEKLKKYFEYAEKRAPKQLTVLMAYMKLSESTGNKNKEISYNDLLKESSNATQAVTALVKKGVFEIYEQESSRFHHSNIGNSNIILNNHQQAAYNEIVSNLKEKEVALLHGVTSSGKTEIYIELIKKCISEGKQVLYLLPEIALTTQIIERLQNHFGEDVGVYHSRFNDMERAEVWSNIAKGGIKSGKDKISYKVVLGARSAVFLPFKNLGLVIVDEEHDANYKQYNPAPRYNGRDTAIYLANMFGAKTILGSATPSVESYYNAKAKKYHLVELFSRHGDIQMPEILIADIKKETRHKKMMSHFSSLLIDNIKKALEEKEQIILFQNRRGFSLLLQCKECEAMPHCKNCDVTLVYHKKIEKLKCHYCGYSQKIPSKCSFCGSANMLMKGFGTQKVEEEIPIFFPDAKIGRMDLDTTRSKNAYQKIISDFEQKKIDVLIGTQMISKGLDFNNVSVVGILNADNLIHFPDFRSYEKAFQQLMQVSGRAGRTKKRGKVIVQTYNPEHDVIKKVINNDYSGMYKQQLCERKEFNYPPFFRLILLSLVHKNPDMLNKSCDELAGKLIDIFGDNVIGPEYPLISRIRNFYTKNIMVKIPKDNKYLNNKKKIKKLLENFQKIQKYRTVRIITDIDPM